MRSRDRPKSQDNRCENATRCEAIGEQREGNVAIREALGHNARTDDACQKQRGADGLRGRAPRKA